MHDDAIGFTVSKAELLISVNMATSAGANNLTTSPQVTVTFTWEQFEEYKRLQENTTLY